LKDFYEQVATGAEKDNHGILIFDNTPIKIEQVVDGTSTTILAAELAGRPEQGRPPIPRRSRAAGEDRPGFQARNAGESAGRESRPARRHVSLESLIGRGRCPGQNTGIDLVEIQH
jgi:hypothetical protein